MYYISKKNSSCVYYVPGKSVCIKLLIRTFILFCILELHSKTTNTLLECMKNLGADIQYSSNNIRSSKGPVDKRVNSSDYKNGRKSAPSFSKSTRFYSNTSTVTLDEELHTYELMMRQQQQHAKFLKAKLEKLVSDEKTTVKFDSTIIKIVTCKTFSCR